MRVKTTRCQRCKTSLKGDVYEVDEIVDRFEVQKRRVCSACRIQIFKENKEFAN